MDNERHDYQYQNGGSENAFPSREMDGTGHTSPLPDLHHTSLMGNDAGYMTNGVRNGVVVGRQTGRATGGYGGSVGSGRRTRSNDFRIAWIRQSFRDRSVVVEGGDYTAEARELDRKKRLHEQLRMARRLRATMERAAEEAENLPVEEARKILLRVRPDINELVSLTEAVRGNYTLDSYDEYTLLAKEREKKQSEEVDSAKKVLHEHLRDMAKERNPSLFRDDANSIAQDFTRAGDIRADERSVVEATVEEKPDKKMQEAGVKRRSSQISEGETLNTKNVNAKLKEAPQATVDNEKPVQKKKKKKIAKALDVPVTSTQKGKKKKQKGRKFLSSVKKLGKKKRKKIKVSVTSAGIPMVSDSNVSSAEGTSESIAPKDPTPSSQDSPPKAEAIPEESTGSLPTKMDHERAVDSPTEIKTPSSPTKSQMAISSTTSPSSSANTTAKTSPKKRQIRKVSTQPRKCHQCKKSNFEFRRCHFWFMNGTKCGKTYCRKCLTEKYSLEDEWDSLLSDTDWHCPSCLGICSCNPCVKQRERLERRSAERRSTSRLSAGFYSF